MRKAHLMKCRVCKCTERRACPNGCSWSVIPEVCTNCYDAASHLAANDLALVMASSKVLWELEATRGRAIMPAEFRRLEALANEIYEKMDEAATKAMLASGELEPRVPKPNDSETPKRRRFCARKPLKGHAPK